MLLMVQNMIQSIRIFISIRTIISIIQSQMGNICNGKTMTAADFRNNNNDNIYQVKARLEQIFKGQAYEYDNITSYIEIIDNIIKQQRAAFLDKSLLLLAQYGYEKAKYFYYHKKYEKSLKQLNQLLNNHSKVKLQKLSLLNIQIFRFLVTYFIEMQANTSIHKILRIIKDYRSLIRAIKQQNISKQHQMILFVSNLAYHLFWFHRAKCIAEKKNDQLRQLNKLVNQQLILIKQLVENYAFMIKIQILKNRQIKQQVYIKYSSNQKRYIQELGMKLNTKNKIQPISRLEIEIQQANISKKASQSYELQKLDQQKYQQYQPYLIQNSLFNKTGQWFPCVNLAMLYISKGQQGESWIKIFKNKKVKRQSKNNWLSLSSNCMAIQILQQDKLNNQQSPHLKNVKQDVNYLYKKVFNSISGIDSNQQKIVQVKRSNNHINNNSWNDPGILKTSDQAIIKNLSYNKFQTFGQQNLNEKNNKNSYHDSLAKIQPGQYWMNQKNLINPQKYMIKPTNGYSSKNWQKQQPQDQKNEGYSCSLLNIGNTCYLNSALQCLHKSKYFKQYLLDKHPKDLQKLSKQLYKFLKEMDKDGKLLNPQSIKRLVGQKNFLFANYSQNDATQFLSTLLSIVSEELNLSNNKNSKFTKIDHYGKDLRLIYDQTKYNDELRCKSIVEETFTGRYKTTYQCKGCYNEYVLFQKFNIHYLQIPVLGQQKGKDPQNYRNYSYNVKFKSCKLQDCLKYFNKPDYLTGANKMTCDICTRQTQNQKVMQIYQANKILIFGLKRFFEEKKNQTAVLFPETLEPKDIMINYKDQSYKGKIYKLYAAILHSGTLNSGHYTAVCFNQKTKKWIEFNDSRVTEFTDVSLDNAYAVFYQLTQEKQGYQTQNKLQIPNSLYYKDSQRTPNKGRQQKQKISLQKKIIKMVILVLLKGINIVSCFDQIISKKTRKGPFTSAFLELDSILTSKNLQNTDINEDLWKKSVDILRVAEQRGESKFKHLVEFYLTSLDKQLSGLDFCKDNFNLRQKAYTKCSRKVHEKLTQKLIHKLLVENYQEPFKIENLIKCYNRPHTVDKNTCDQCGKYEKKGKFESKGKILYRTNMKLIFQIQKNITKKLREPPKMPLKLKAQDVMTQHNHPQFQNTMYSLKGVISVENQMYEVSYFDKSKRKWYLYDGQKTFEMQNTYSFPNAVMLFYLLEKVNK